ncbi:MAG: HNH endonuclease [Actinobacteria bacterium]|nr:HNH endonuclease [Actinomycetota bacterium]
MSPDIALVQLGGHQSHTRIAGYARIDEDAADEIGQHNWSMDADGYAFRLAILPDGRKRVVRMHRQVLGLKHCDGQVTDHINRDKLDNRRANLRVGTHALNCQNMPLRRTSRSGFRGVRRNREGRWQAFAHLRGAFHHLGVFVDPVEAASVAAEFRRQRMPWATD